MEGHRRFRLDADGLIIQATNDDEMRVADGFLSHSAAQELAKQKRGQKRLMKESRQQELHAWCLI